MRRAASIALVALIALGVGAPIGLAAGGRKGPKSGSGRVASVRLVEAGRPVPDPSGEGARLVRRLSRQDLGRGAVRIGGKGRIIGRVGE